MSATGPPAGEYSGTSATRLGRRHREDHDRPPGGQQRIPAADGHRDARAFEEAALRTSRSARIILTGEERQGVRESAATGVRGDAGYEEQPGRGGSGRFHVTDLHVQPRLPRPVVAMSRDYAVGGGPRAATSAATDHRPRQRPASRQTGRASARAIGGFGASRWPAQTASSAPRRSGSCAASTTPRRARDWGRSTRSCRSRAAREETVQWCREMLPSPLRLRM